MTYAAIDSCVCTIKVMKDKLVRNGKLEEFLNYTNVNSVSQHENVVDQDKAQREKQTRRQKKAASSDYMGISFQNIPLKGCDLPGFSEELNHLIDKTVDITVKELERRFEMMRDNTQHKNTKRAEIIRCFSVFCHDSWPDDIHTFGENEIDTLLKWYQDILLKNGCDISAVQAKCRLLKALAKGQFSDKSYCSLWEVLLTKEPYFTDFQNVLHLVEIMFVLPISAAQCERGFSAQNRIKSKVRNSLHVSTLEDLIRISTEGPSLEQFDPEPCVKRWLSAKKKRRRPNYTQWPSDAEIIMVSDTGSDSA